MEKVTKTSREVINNSALVEEFRLRGGRIYHILPVYDNFSKKWSRGITIAYIRKNGRIEVATSLQHKSDCFTKKMGTRTAITHFNEGKTIFLPANSDIHDNFERFTYY